MFFVIMSDSMHEGPLYQIMSLLESKVMLINLYGLCDNQ